MLSQPITSIYPRPDPNDDPLPRWSSAYQGIYGRFAAALEPLLGVPVPVVMATSTAPVRPTGYVCYQITFPLLAGCINRGIQPAALAQTIWIHSAHQHILADAEAYHPLAVIAWRRLFRWSEQYRTPSPFGTGQGMYGRNPILAQLGWESLTPVESPNYALFGEPKANLPALLVAYLAAVEAAKPGAPHPTAPLSALERTILHLIAQHDGQWRWYQLDRGLVRAGIDPAELRHLMLTLKTLIARGWLRAEGRGLQPRYGLTDAGREATSYARTNLTA